jgi:hypothetical protein
MSAGQRKKRELRASAKARLTEMIEQAMTCQRSSVGLLLSIQKLLARVGICGLPNSDTNKCTHSYLRHCDTQQDALRTVENREWP